MTALALYALTFRFGLRFGAQNVGSKLQPKQENRTKGSAAHFSPVAHLLRIPAERVHT